MPLTIDPSPLLACLTILGALLVIRWRQSPARAPAPAFVKSKQ